MNGTEKDCGLGDARTIYESEWATIVHGDAGDALQSVATESVDLVLTDPPYGVEWQSGFRRDTFDALIGDGRSDREGVRAILEQCVRIVGQNRHLYVFGPDDVLAGLKVSEAVELIWDKQRNGAGDLSSAWAPAHERINFCTSKHRHAGQKGASNLPTRLRKGSVLNFMPPSGRNVRHPSEKPVGLLSELIESSSKRGELVLDPFAGVGSTGVAAVLAGRRALMIEVDERYAQIAVERVKAAEKVMESAVMV